MIFQLLLATIKTAKELVVSFSVIELGLITLFLFFLGLYVIFSMRQFITNSLLGIGALVLFNVIGMGIKINVLTVFITAIFGLFGAALLVLLQMLHFSL